MVGCGGMDRHGRAQAVVVISPARRWWAWWLRLSWPLADRNPLIKRTLVRLAFIHVAHWALVDKVPARDTGAGTRRLPHPYLLFQSNFNDNLAAYIDAFALIVPWRMRLMWHGAYGFPGTGGRRSLPELRAGQRDAGAALLLRLPGGVVADDRERARAE